MIHSIVKVESKELKLTLPNGNTSDSQSFSVEQGTLCCLHGTNGSGKSVLLSMLAGSSLPSGFKMEGRLVAKHQNGTDVTLSGIDAPEEYRREISTVTQRLGGTLIALKDKDDYGLAVEGAEGTHAQRTERLREVLEVIGRETLLAREGTERSYAQTRILEIACAVSTGQSVYLFDEPLLGLDQHSAKIVLKLLHWLTVEKRKLVIITQHEPMTVADLRGPTITNVPLSYSTNGGTANEFEKILELALVHLKSVSTQPLVPDFDGSIRSKADAQVFARMRNLSVNRINWVIGGNGSGKSTLIGALGGLIRRGRPIPGFRYREGFHIDLGDWEDRRVPNPEVHVVLQNPFASFVELRVTRDLPARFSSAHSLFGGTDRAPTKFSYGQLRFLQTLLIPVEARLLIFDEPLMGLAADKRGRMLNSIRDIPATGRCVICTALSDSEAASDEPQVKLS